ARIVADTRMDWRARRFAAGLLGEIGHERPLDPASLEALITAGRPQGDETRLPAIAIEAIEEASGLSREMVVERLTRSGATARRQDTLFPAPLLARLARVSIAEDLPLLKGMMERFGDAAGIEAHYVVEAAMRIPGQPAADVLGNWFIRYAALRPHIGFGLA